MGNPIPTFISRRLAALSKSGIKVVAALGYGQLNNLPPEVEIVRYGNLGQMGLMDLFKFAIKIFFKPLVFFQIFKALEGRPFTTRIKLSICYFPVSILRSIHLIHVQWLGLVPDLFWLKTIYHAPLVASVRGSQVTVYPYVQQGYSDSMRKAFQLSDACHLVSNDLRVACLTLGAEPSKLFVNYNGINLERFNPPVYKSPHHRLRLVSVGALIWRKGYAFQILMIHHLQEAGINVSLTIVGSGNDLKGLLYTAKSLGVADSVSFVGQLSETEIANTLSTNDVYLSTSLAEGLPNSLVEAAASGLPIIAFDCEGVREVVEHEVSGFVVAPGQIEEAAHYVRQLTDESLRRALGANGRQRMERLFNQDVCVKEMIKHYQRCIDAN